MGEPWIREDKSVAITFRDTMSGKVRVFEPLEEGHVRMYHCGPTVYDYAHIGNFRAFLLADLLRRLFEFHGYEVHQVMNITDVGHMTVDTEDAGEDKMAAAAQREGRGPEQIARFYEEAFFEDLDALGIRRADRYPRASEHVTDMVGLAQALYEKGFAYQEGDTVLYDISKYPEYGRLSHKRIEDLQAGAGGRLTEEMLAGKRNPGDFRLWKVDPDHVLQWESPWGPGYPGWHLECSVMARKYLGDTLDIHTGGEDNIFPHHESERAQIEPITGKPFVRYWLHNRHLMCEGTKMSKSLGNFYTVRGLLDEGFDPIAIRYLLISAHYRAPLNFTREGLKGAWECINRIRNFVRRMDENAQLELEGADTAGPGAAAGTAGPACGGDAGTPATGSGPTAAGAAEAPGDERTDTATITQGFLNAFTEAIDEDLNMSKALGSVFDFMREINRRDVKGQVAVAAAAAIRRADEVLGILAPDEEAQDKGDPRVDALVEERQAARKARDFARADEIRDQLMAEGIVIEDTKDGVRWYRK